MMRSPVSQPPNSSTPATEKRNASQLSDDSIDLDSVEGGLRPNKQSKWDSDLDLSPITTDKGMSKFLKSLVNQLKGKLTDIENKLDKQNADINERLDRVENRIEEEFSRRQLFEDEITGRMRVLESANEELRGDNERMKDSNEELFRRIADLEARELSPQIPSLPVWQPSGPIKTKILLLGDSNSAGKLKFGEGKGKLGKALPGVDKFCASFENLPDTKSGIFDDITDVLFCVGTNNLKLDSCEPVTLVKDLYTYLSTLLNDHPSLQVFLPGVLPTSHRDPSANSRISQYNHYLCNLCRSNAKLTFIDTNSFRTQSGTLKTALGRGEGDPLHLSEGGLKFYFSRLKYALRAHYNLPVGRSFRQRNDTERVNTGGSADRGRPHSRGGTSNRGGGNRTSRGGGLSNRGSSDGGGTPIWGGTSNSS